MMERHFLGQVADYFGLLFVVVLISGCSGNLNGEISTTFKTVDFQKSEIISNGPAYADGSSELLMVIQLANSDSSPVKDFRPTYQILSGANVTATECTSSNANGVSTCVLKSTQAGTKRVQVTNIKVDLQKDLVFINPPASKPMNSLVAAAKKQTSGTLTLRANVGNPEADAVKTSGSFKLYGGFQGDVFSR